MNLPKNLDRARKAQVVGVSGVNGWCLLYLPLWASGLIAVAAATYLAWLVPKEADVPEPWVPPDLT